MNNNSLNLMSAIAHELQLSERSVTAVVHMFQEGSTIPFIARYRKEATGNLDEVQLRAIQERHTYMVELEERRSAILKSIQEQQKLTPELKAQILACTTKTVLEDLYLPYKPKRRTRAMIAREKGLEPLALRILEQPLEADVQNEAFFFISEHVDSVQTALAGARDIVAEMLSEHAALRGDIRALFMKQSDIVSEAVPETTKEPTKFEQYYAFKEPISKIPSHRYLAIRRGEKEGFLRVHVQLPYEAVAETMRQHAKLAAKSPFATHLELAIQDSFTRLLAPSLETEIRLELKQRSDKEAVDIFASNLRSLLLQSPLGSHTVIGIDPGIRTGCKLVVLDATGKFLFNTTLFLSQGEGALHKAQQELHDCIRMYQAKVIAIGNGTASRETEQFVRRFIKDAQLQDMIVVTVNEAGASVYSASDIAREEFPELDVTVRGAISIARRLQDPLAELVKIDPKAIGVGQYQHDVHQPLLAKTLDSVVESCVNHVGVELNTASAPLLAHVAGIGPSLAQKIVQYRQEQGPFATRMDLFKVPGMGPKTFEQAAGFLRIRDSKEVLDRSAVHPERYMLVEKIASDLETSVEQLIGHQEYIDRIHVQQYVSDTVGLPTLQDIIAELKKPGRDPRASFEAPQFRDDVLELKDVQVDMEFEGVVTNVTAFGAFVDIGVHQDGLVHISQLGHKFVSDPHQVVKAGDKMRVKVLEIDHARKRISLTAKLGAKPENMPTSQQPHGQKSKPTKQNTPKTQFSNNPFAKLGR